MKMRAIRTVLLCLSCVVSLSSSGLQKPVVVSVYQGPCREGDFAANLDTCRQVIEQARARGSHFVAFPECFLSGYESAEAVRRGARPLSDPDLRAFIEESRTHDTVVLAGLALSSGTQLFNSVLVIHRGRLLGRYDKVMLTPGDRNTLGFTAGAELPVFEANGARFGVLICADTSYPHVAMAAKLQGAEILFTPHNNAIRPAVMEDHLRWVRNCHIGIACHYQVVVARANVVQSDRPTELGYGDSFILGPQGTPLSEAGLFRTELLTALVTPGLFESPQTWAAFQDAPAWLRTGLAELLVAHRTPSKSEDLSKWLESMAIDHRYSREEMAAATGLGRDELVDALARHGLLDPPAPRPRGPGEPVRVLPYPGGRHPRQGFFDGARNPQRETKVSVFPPWDQGGYAVVDVPEAIFSNLGLIHLAHTHIPTVWDQQDATLPRLEWTRRDNGSLSLTRTLPNGISFGAEARARTDGVVFALWLKNGTRERLTGLRVQNCVMLGRATGFAESTLANKVFAQPFAAARSTDGKRWIITAWEACGRTWGNELVPCIHSDPVFPDCDPGATVRVSGWLSFFEGPEIEREFERLKALGVPSIPTTD
ncbi:MAG: carbon-nitrogen hydrolase family protein [Limisphaerales bacterium]